MQFNRKLQGTSPPARQANLKFCEDLPRKLRSLLGFFFVKKSVSLSIFWSCLAKKNFRQQLLGFQFLVKLRTLRTLLCLRQRLFTVSSISKSRSNRCRFEPSKPSKPSFLQFFLHVRHVSQLEVKRQAHMQEVMVAESWMPPMPVEERNFIAVNAAQNPASDSVWQIEMKLQ